MISKKKLELLQRQLKDNCENCNGKGCQVCSVKISRYGIYARAEIPADYWPLSFKRNFYGDKNFGRLIQSKIKTIKEVYTKGESFIFVGNLGTGKTFGATTLLKAALLSDFSGKYVHMTDIISNILSPSVDSKVYMEELISIDFLLVDEFDTRFIAPSDKAEAFVGKTMEHILRNRFQNGMPTFLCSNVRNVDQILTGDFGRAFSSLRAKYTKTVLVAGKDFRKSGN